MDMNIRNGSYGVYVANAGYAWLLQGHTGGLMEGCHAHPITAT